MKYSGSWEKIVLTLFPYRYAVDKFRECNVKVRFKGTSRFPDENDIREMLSISLKILNLDPIEHRKYTKHLYDLGYSRFWKYFTIKSERYYNNIQLDREHLEVRTKTRAQVVMCVSTRSRKFSPWAAGSGEIIFKLYRNGTIRIMSL